MDRILYQLLKEKILELKEKISEMELEMKKQRSRIEVLERALDGHDHDGIDVLEDFVTRMGRKMGMPER